MNINAFSMYILIYYIHTHIYIYIYIYVCILFHKFLSDYIEFKVLMAMYLYSILDPQA